MIIIFTDNIDIDEKDEVELRKFMRNLVLNKLNLNIIVIGIQINKDKGDKLNEILDYNRISGFISIEDFPSLRRRIMTKGSVGSFTNFTNEKFEANKKNK